MSVCPNSAVRSDYLIIPGQTADDFTRPCLNCPGYVFGAEGTPVLPIGYIDVRVLL